MTDCQNGEMRDLLPDLLHDRLAPARRAELEAHVATCAECREELALLAAVRGTLRRAPAVNLPAIAGALPAYRAPARRSRGEWRAAAAIAAITIGGAAVAIARHEPVPSPSPAAVASRPAPTPVRDSPSIAPSPASPVVPAPVHRVAQSAPRRELAVAGTVGDLTEAELRELLKGLESLDATPAASVDAEANSLAPAADLTTRGAT